MLKSLLTDALKSKEFQNIYNYGIKNGLIVPFSNDFIQKMKDYYIPFIDCTLYDYFQNGDNIGFCLQACEYLAEMFDEYEIHKGLLSAIKNTKRSPNGEHAWLVSNGIIYDTSLLLIIDESLADLLGYRPDGLVRTNKRFKAN